MIFERARALIFGKRIDKGTFAYINKSPTVPVTDNTIEFEPLFQRYRYSGDAIGYFKLEPGGQFQRILIDFIRDLSIDKKDQFTIGLDALRQGNIGATFDDLLVTGRRLSDGSFRLVVMRGTGREWGSARVPSDYEATLRVGFHGSENLDVPHVIYEVGVANRYFLGRDSFGLHVETYDASTDTLAVIGRGWSVSEWAPMYKRIPSDRLEIDESVFKRPHEEKETIQDDATIEILRFFESAYTRRS